MPQSSLPGPASPWQSSAPKSIQHGRHSLHSAAVARRTAHALGSAIPPKICGPGRRRAVGPRTRFVVADALASTFSDGRLTHSSDLAWAWFAVQPRRARATAAARCSDLAVRGGPACWTEADRDGSPAVGMQRVYNRCCPWLEAVAGESGAKRGSVLAGSHHLLSGSATGGPLDVVTGTDLPVTKDPRENTLAALLDLRPGRLGASLLGPGASGTKIPPGRPRARAPFQPCARRSGTCSHAGTWAPSTSTASGVRQLHARDSRLAAGAEQRPAGVWNCCECGFVMNRRARCASQIIHGCMMMLCEHLCCDNCPEGSYRL